MGQIFNSPPGWPKPPEGWTPPPGWAPDPSWPQAPDGWQFWVDDPFAAAVSGSTTPPAASEPPSASPPPSNGQPPQGPDHQQTQTMGTSPTQVMGQSPAQPSLYSYAPSGGLEQPGASPYSPSASQPGGYTPGGPPSGGGFQGGQYSSPGAPGPKPRNTLAIAVVAIVAVLVLGGIVWGLTSLFSGGDEEPTAGGDPSTEVESTGAATPDPTDDPTTDEPTTDEPTDDPTTDEPTDNGGGGGSTAGVTDLTGSDPAIVFGSSGDPVVEVRLVEAEAGWESSEQLCSDPENGQYLGLTLEFTILPAMADESEGTYTFIGWELGAEADGVALETSAFATGLFCVNTADRAPSEMQPGETYTGLSVLDVPDSVTAVTFEDIFDFTGADMYRWVLADQ